MQNRLNQEKTTTAPTFLDGAVTVKKATAAGKSRYGMCSSSRGFRYDIAYYYQILKKTRQTSVLSNLSVRHEARALAMYIADEEFGRQHLYDYLGITANRAATLTHIADAYNVDYKKRDLVIQEGK